MSSGVGVEGLESWKTYLQGEIGTGSLGPCLGSCLEGSTGSGGFEALEWSSRKALQSAGAPGGGPG